MTRRFVQLDIPVGFYSYLVGRHYAVMHHVQIEVIEQAPVLATVRNGEDTFVFRTHEGKVLESIYVDSCFGDEHFTADLVGCVADLCAPVANGRRVRRITRCHAQDGEERRQAAISEVDHLVDSLKVVDGRLMRRLASPPMLLANEGVVVFSRGADPGSQYNAFALHEMDRALERAAILGGCTQLEVVCVSDVDIHPAYWDQDLKIDLGIRTAALTLLQKAKHVLPELPLPAMEVFCDLRDEMNRNFGADTEQQLQLIESMLSLTQASTFPDAIYRTMEHVLEVERMRQSGKQPLLGL